MMSLGSLNYLPIFAAAIASFVFGGIWYNVFSKQWMDAVGMSPEDVEDMYRLLALAKYDERYVIPAVHPELGDTGAQLAGKAKKLSGKAQQLCASTTSLVRDTTVSPNVADTQFPSVLPGC